MTAGFRRRPLAAAAILAALGLCISCTDTGGGNEDRGSKSRPPQSRSSLFDEDKPVTVAVKRYQPGFSTRGGKEQAGTGFDVALSRFLADEVGFEKDLDGIPSDARERKLIAGDVDLAVATYTITDAREAKIDFTAPYLKTYQGLLVRKDAADIEKLKDVRGKRVCSVAGSTSDPGSAPDRQGQEAISKAIGADVRTGLRKDYKECVEDLRKGDFAAVWTDKILLEGFAHTPPYSDYVKVAPDITIENRQFYGIGIKEGHGDDCRRINKSLKKFLGESWRETFRAHFPELADSDPNFEQKYKPTANEFNTYAAKSCGAR